MFNLATTFGMVQRDFGMNHAKGLFLYELIKIHET